MTSMGHVGVRVVLDTNILLRGLLNEFSPSGKILKTCERRNVIPLLSHPVLLEYRAILSDPELVAQYPQLERQRVKRVLERLAYIGDVVRITHDRFDLPRDPKDSKLIESDVPGKASGWKLV